MNPIRKTAGHLGRTFVSLAVLAILAVSGLVAHAAEGVAKVMLIRKGHAYYSEGGTNWSRLQVGMRLRPGTKIQTGSRTRVDLHLKKNGPVLQIYPTATVEVTKLAFESSDDEDVIDTEISLNYGLMVGAVKKLHARSSYRIRIPMGVLSLRSGGVYQLRASGRLMAYEQLTVVYRPVDKTSSSTVTILPQKVFDPSANNGEGAVVEPSQEEIEIMRQYPILS